MSEEVEMADEVEEAAQDGAETVDPWPRERVVGAVEAALFASPDALTLRALRGLFPAGAADDEALNGALEALVQHYDRPGSGIVLQKISGGWQILTREQHYDVVAALGRTRTEEKITAAALETLAIVAYKQPITRAEIDAIRGVSSGQILRTLMDKKMVKVVGRVDLPGRPFQYGTTRQFLEHFGLGNIKDLPQGKDI